MELKTVAIIVAAGQGLRLGGDLPKQFQVVAGKPVICHTLQRFESAPSIDEIILVTGKRWLLFVTNDIVKHYGLAKVKQIIEGGNERQDSVYEALRRIDDADMVVVHDAVRPLISIEKIEYVISVCKEHDAVVLAVPPKDTIKECADGIVIKTLDRRLLRCVQTPQAFKYDLLLKAYKQAYKDDRMMTDDSALVERIGQKVKVVEGCHENIKVTVLADLRIAEALLQAAQ